MCELIRKEIDSRKELENIEFLSFFFFFSCILHIIVDDKYRYEKHKNTLKNVEKKHKKKVD